MSHFHPQGLCWFLGLSVLSHQPGIPGVGIAKLCQAKVYLVLLLQAREQDGLLHRQVFLQKAHRQNQGFQLGDQVLYAWQREVSAVRNGTDPARLSEYSSSRNRGLALLPLLPGLPAFELDRRAFAASKATR